MTKHRLLTSVLSVSLILCFLCGCMENAVNIDVRTSEPDDLKWLWSDVKENVSRDESVRCEDDFYLYVNKDWILDNNLPDGYSEFSPRVECTIRNAEKSINLLEDTSLKGDEAREVQDLYRCILDWDHRNEDGYKQLKNRLDEIWKIEDIEGLYDYITDTSSEYHETLFDYIVSEDPEDSSHKIFQVFQKSLMLDDPEEYSNRSENGQLEYDLNLHIFEYMMEKMGYDTTSADAIFESAIAFESKLAGISYSLDEIYDEEYDKRSLNKMSPQELIELCGSYQMDSVLKSLGMDNEEIINVTNPNYFKGLQNIVTKDNLEEIKNLLVVAKVISLRNFLDEDTYRATSEILNEYYGIDGTVSDREYASEIVMRLMPIQFQQLYAMKYGAKDDREKIENICKLVVDTYEEMLEENDYLSLETKKEAIKKLKGINIYVAYPDKWPDVSGMKLSNKSVFDALVESERFNIEYNLSQAGKTNDKDLWIDIGGVSLTECNAFYSSYNNSIYMMLGMIDDPFYNDDMCIEDIYASIAAFWIGHEISHAFDADGSWYDKDGNYTNWWSDADREEYNKRIEKLEDYLSSIRVYDDEYLRGENVSEEMLADFTGLQCALKMADKVDDFDYSRFFIKYAQLFRTISSQNNEELMLAVDTHPLSFIRTNVSVQQFDEFYETFGVGKDDKMYLSPDERLLIW